MTLAAEYQPQNFYCYLIDSKTSEVFKKRVRNLATCFPNVIVAKKEFDMDSTGKNMNFAYLEGMKLLKKYSWNYVILLQVRKAKTIGFLLPRPLLFFKFEFFTQNLTFRTMT